MPAVSPIDVSSCTYLNKCLGWLILIYENIILYCTVNGMLNLVRIQIKEPMKKSDTSVLLIPPNSLTNTSFMIKSGFVNDRLKYKKFWKESLKSWLLGYEISLLTARIKCIQYLT